MKKHIPLLLLIASGFITWWRLAVLTVRGDSLIYFLHRYHDIYLNKDFYIRMANFDWSALLFGKILEHFFGTNILMYGLVEVIVLIITVGMFYWMMLVVTKKQIVAFAAGLILCVSYYGNWDMYAGGIYLVFLERVPPMLFLIPSFAFLHLFLDKKLKKYYLYSILLFFLGVGIAHWGAFFTAPFVLYPVFWSLMNDKKKNKKKLFAAGLQGFIYFCISLFFVIIQNILHPGLVPDWSFKEFLLNPGFYNYPINIVRQLVYWSTYLPFVNILKASFVVSPIAVFVKTETSLIYTPIVLVVYLLAFGLTYVKLPNYRTLLLTVFLSVISIYFFNAYFGQYQMQSQAGSSRYQYLPTYLLAIFWSLFLWAVFWQKKSAKYILGIVILLCFAITNYWLVSENFKWVEDIHEKSKKVWRVALDLGSGLPEGSYVIVPQNETGPYEAEFLTDQFEDRRITFIVDSEDWKKQVSTQEKVYLISYKNECMCATWQKMENVNKE